MPGVIGWWMPIKTVQLAPIVAGGEMLGALMLVDGVTTKRSVVARKTLPPWRSQ